MIHQPVLLTEAIDGLAVKADGIYIDGTFGRGGHSREILAQLNANGRLFAIDKDPEAVLEGQRQFAQDARFCITQGSFANLRAVAKQQEICGKVNGILLDLGVSSPQLDDPARGFSFLKDGPLDMRMDPSRGISAADWLKNAKDSVIAEVLKDYGEERYARRIARAIVRERNIASIETTARLAKIAAEANPAWEKGKNPATRTFQAIRIFINQELEDLQSVLEQSLDVLATGGRLVVISFHSLEDRIVKRFMRSQAKGTAFPAGLPVTQAQLNPNLRLVGKSIKPGLAELERNPRARSAVLRIGEKRV